MLIIAGALILLVTYLVKDIVKEWAKDVASTAESSDALYRTELGQSSLSIQMMQIQQQISAIRQDSEDSGASEKDYSDTIKADLIIAQQMRSDLSISVDRVSRLIDKLPFGAKDLRRELEILQPNIEKANQQINEMFKPTQTRDWTRAVQVKLAIIGAAIQIILVEGVGDVAQAKLQGIKKDADRLYAFTVWASYLLYALGIGLALYAGLSGKKGFRSE